MIFASGEGVLEMEAAGELDERHGFDGHHEADLDGDHGGELVGDATHGSGT